MPSAEDDYLEAEKGGRKGGKDTKEGKEKKVSNHL